MYVGFKLLLSKKSAEQAAVLNENKVMDKKKKIQIIKWKNNLLNAYAITP